MPIIYTFPSKGTPVLADKVLISDSQDGEATKNATISSIKDTIDVVDRITAGPGISVSSNTGNITIGNTGVLGSGTANKITKWSANGSVIENSIITEDGGPGINIAGNVAVGFGSYISTPSILDDAGEFGSANQVLSAGSSGSSIEWTSTFKGDLNGTINTATTGVTQANAIDNTTIATTAYVNNKIGLIPAGLEYSGTWDANTNNPTLASGVGTTGAFYIVAASGSTNLDGITDWKVGDWAIFVESGATDAWQKVDNTSVLNGSGTGQKVSLWSGSGTSVTLTDSIMTQNPQGGNFAGQYIDISGSGGISASQFSIGGRLLDGNNFQGVDGYVLSSTTVGGNRKTAWVPQVSNFTAGTGLTLTGTVFSANTFGTQSAVAVAASSTTQRSYPIQTGAVSGATGTNHLVVNVPWETELASTTVVGGFKLLTNTAGTAPSFTTTTANRNYAIQRDSNGRAMVNVPWTETSYVLPTASSAALGGIKTHGGYGSQVTIEPITTTSSRNYGITLNADAKAFVNVPWVDTNTTLQATQTTTGGMKIYNDVVTVFPSPRTNTANRSYGIQINSGGGGQVNVPWTDTTPTASAGIVGGIRLATNTVATSQNGISTTASRNYGLQIDSLSRGVINVPWTDTNTTYTTATSSTLGLVKIGYSENGKNYPVELLNDQMFVNVPWTGTNFTAGTGLTLTGTVFSANTAGAGVVANSPSSVSLRSYPIQTGGVSGLTGVDHLIVNVPWETTLATANAVGGFKLLTNTTGTSPSSTSATANRNYAIQKDSSGIAMVNVPWTGDTTASTTVTGGIKSYVNYGSAIPVNPRTLTTARSYGVAINLSGQAFVNVPWTDSATTYTAGTGLTLNGAEFNANVGEVTQTQAANSATDTQLRTYEIQVDSSDNLVVNVPWADTNTTYTAGTGLTLSGTVFNVDVATSGALGGIKSHLNYGSQVTVNSITSTGSRFYGVVINDDDKAMVNVPWTDTVTPVVTASQGLTKTSNNITLDIADPATGWAILGGGPGAGTQIIGGYAGANATGSKNFGISSFIQSSSVTSANNNVAIGFDSMGTAVTTASNNVVIGGIAGANMTTATDSVLVGKRAGTDVTTATDSVLVGNDAGKGITTGGENTIIGSNAGETITTGSRNTIIGSGAVATTGAASVFATIIGREASATTSSVAVGSNATVAGATGVAVGDSASTASNALNGIALGRGAQATLQGTVGNVAIGSAVFPVSLDQPEAFSANVNHLNVTINGTQYYIRLYKEGE